MQDIKLNLIPTLNDKNQARLPLDLMTSQDDLNASSSLCLTQGSAIDYGYYI